MKKLSIIIVNFNTFDFLKECIRSIYKHTEKLRFEVIVVDNASTDGSIEKLNKNGQELKITKLIINKKNVGFAKANNQGIKKSSGDYILLLNPDTLIFDDVLEKLVLYMDQDQKTGVATCKVIMENGQLDDACHRGFPTPLNAFCQFSGLAKLFPSSTIFNGYHLGYRQMDMTHEIDACAGAFMIVRKTVGEKVKWLDEDYFWYGEDLDFCYRIKQAGWKIMYVPKVQITHFKGVSGGIKKHSQHLTTANKETKLLTTKARFEVMRIFYSKHYKDKYPGWLTVLILSAIKIKEYFTLLILNIEF